MMHSKTQTTDTTGRADRQSGNVVCNSTFTRRQRPPRRVAQLSEENRPKVGYCPQGKRVERIPSPSKLVTPRVTLDVAAALDVSLLHTASCCGWEERLTAASGPRPGQQAAMVRAPELSRTQPAARAQAPGSPASPRMARLEGPGEKVTVHLLLHSLPKGPPWGWPPTRQDP